MEEDETVAWFGSLPPRLTARVDEDPNCPTCGTRMKPIMYGFPSSPPPEDADYVLGGCVIFPGQPMFTCPTCDNP
ncbi:MAG: hypothetical protein EBR52_08420 [Microbacteriaceae bacterium]|nr:hypothetical protein [Microbacteriaceae bacterium]